MLKYPISDNTNPTEKDLFLIKKKIDTNAYKKIETALIYHLNEL